MIYFKTSVSRFLMKRQYAFMYFNSLFKKIRRKERKSVSENQIEVSKIRRRNRKYRERTRYEWYKKRKIWLPKKKHVWKKYKTKRFKILKQLLEIYAKKKRKRWIPIKTSKILENIKFILHRKKIVKPQIKLVRKKERKRKQIKFIKSWFGKLERKR